MKRRKLTIIAISLLNALTVSATTVATYAWFKYGNDITFGGNSDDVPIKAGANSSYYGGGDGSETNPFIISKPIHLYNLAWLQYIGTYNTPTIQQKYFKVTNDINMNEITLPPIGTEQYPFLSNFDGNNKTISNLTITNADPKTSDEYGVMKPDNTVLADTTQTKIVGFFGVVGKLPNQDITYSSSVLELKNITLDNISVASKTSETLIGLAAGYVDGTMSGVKIDGTANLDVNGQTSTSISSITSNLSDYGLVGFSKQTGTGGSYSQKLSEFYRNYNDSEGGGDDWGGSLDMKSFNNRIKDIFNTQSPSYFNTSSKNFTYISNDEMKITLGRGSTNMQTYMQQDPNTTQTFYVLLGDGDHYASTSTYQNMPGTVMPLLVNSDFSTSDKNTGYLISDTRAETSSTYKNKNRFNSSIRSSSYRIGHIGNSISDTAILKTEAYNSSGNASTVAFNASTAEILTNSSATYSANNYVLIKDTYNSSHTPLNTYLTNFNKNDTTTPAALGLSKYDDARSSLNDILDNASVVHGIHFMDQDLNYNNTASVNSVKINGNTYSNYLFPKSCIDFNLKENGKINFFGGSYYQNTNSESYADCFFGLSVINRDGQDLTATSIQKISYIYKNTNTETNKTYPYIYYNANNSLIESGYTSAEVTQGELVFDMRYLSETPPVDNAIYYFEIPVNKGEYALHGVSGHDAGGYLMYLDIGASASEPGDRVEAKHITTIKTGNPFPIGVDFAPVSVSGNGGETIGIIIASSKQGVVTFVVTSANIKITDTSSIAVYSFRGSKYKTNDPPDGYFIVSGDSPGAPPALSGGGERVLNIALTTTGGNAHSIKITDQLDESGNIVSSVYELDGSTTGVTKESIEALSSELNIDSLRALNLAATLTRASGTGEFETTYDIENCSYADKIIDVDITLNGTTISISVEDGYTLKVGGVSKTSNSVYP